MPLSIFIIAVNEADRIGRTIEAVRHLTDDLVVVDSGSTDSTREVAEALGARVIVNPWPGYGPQKRFAEDACRHEWLLNLDADEVVPPELASEIAGLFAAGDPPLDGYRLKIGEVFPGETRPHPWAYTLDPVRLYRRDRGRYVDSPVHDRVAFEGTPQLGTLKGVVHHFSVRSLVEQTQKLVRYAEQQAADLDRRGIRLSRWRILTEFPLSFVKAYVFRRHWVRGLYGVATAVNFAYFRWLRVARHYERRRMRGEK